jgi:hypothetical protein
MMSVNGVKGRVALCRALKFLNLIDLSIEPVIDFSLGFSGIYNRPDPENRILRGDTPEKRCISEEKVNNRL